MTTVKSVPDLTGQIQALVIETLKTTAAANNCKMREDRVFGGWYQYEGDIDTWMIAENIAKHFHPSP